MSPLRIWIRLALAGLCLTIAYAAPPIDLSRITSPIIFRGDLKTAYRDPAVFFHNGTFHLFLSLMEVESDGKEYWYTAKSTSTDLVHWTPPKKFTPRDRNLNFASPGNVVRYGGRFVLCLQTYPTPNDEVFGNQDSRVWIMRSTDLEHWDKPEILMVKGPGVAVKDMGRMIDPYLLQDKDDPGKWWCFYKQKGVSMSWSRDLKTWIYAGHADAGENVCVIVDRNEYVLFHSPRDGIGVKRSTDLREWRDEGLIMLGKADWPWANRRLTAGFVVDMRKDPRVGKYLMFFHGDTGEGPKTHGAHGQGSVALAWSDDLVKWDWPGKPAPQAWVGEIREHPGGKEVPPGRFVRAISEADSPVQRLSVQSKDGAIVTAALRKPKGDGPFPALFFVHGWPGGRSIDELAQWTLGADGSPLLEGFLKQGFVVVATDYRKDAQTVAQALLPISADRVTSLDDCVAVLDDVAALPFVDRSRITLYGSSLGGHLVARMAGQRKVSGAIVGGAVLPGLLGAKVPDTAGRASDAYRNLPINAAMARRNVEAIQCPMLLLVSQDDFMADINRKFYDLMAEARKPVRMEYYLHAYHGFETGPGAMAGPGKGKLPVLEGTVDALARALAFAQAPVMPRSSTGIIALPDLGKSKYKGERGGLYPGGSNTVPAAHLKAGIALARQIAPVDSAGRPSPDGKIVLLTVGYSNTRQESEVFLELCSRQADLNPKMVLVDGAENSMGAWAAAEPHGKYWDIVAERLKKAGVAAPQVQAVWMKQANGRPSAAFPAEVKKMYADLVADVNNLHDHFPNLKVVFLSSRIYGGWANVTTSPEPHAYEGGFAFKWLIADQLAGKPEVNYDPAKGAVRSPWLAWGPYLWADGLKGRKDGKLIWERDDFGDDGTHPSVKGRQEVAGLLLDFFRHDPVARPWFVRQ